jgi:hypothetical protein
MSRGSVPGVQRRQQISWQEGCLTQEEFYLDENVQKAIQIDEWSEDALTTSMVDDVFFILQKCGRRALATGSLQCLCAILGQLNNLLSNSLRAALEYNWKVVPYLLFSALKIAVCGLEGVRLECTSAEAVNGNGSSLDMGEQGAWLPDRRPVPG